MLGNEAAGVLGLVLQAVVFATIVMLRTRNQGLSRALVDGGVVAAFGYALIVSFTSLLAVPWQATNVVLTLAVGVCMFFPRVRASLAEGFTLVVAAIRRSWPPVVIVGVVLVFLIAISAIEAELSIDGQLYHGPALANIVQSGSLWGWSATNEYVYYTNLSVAGGVNLASFAGDARFDNALQVPHLLLLVFAVNWALTRRFTAPFVRVSLALLVVSAPVIWLQPRILYVDLAYGSAVATLIFFAVLVREFRRVDVVIVGILLGAVFATKPTGILTGLFLLAVMVVVVIVRRRNAERRRGTVAAVMVGFGAPLLMATSFYVRNLFQFGNPVFPVKVSFGPISFPGILDLSVFASGERGDGLVDSGRWVSYAGSIASGMLHGVTKFDYDPRGGGFGMVPLVVLAIVVALGAVQLVVRIRAQESNGSWIGNWKIQLGIVSISAVILLVQPSTFDSRYVIGPTAALLAAALLTSTMAIPRIAQLFAGVVTLVVAFGQVVWTERTMYPGLQTAIDIMRGPSEWQPNTPGNPRGQGLQVAWLPNGPTECVSIAIQTAGGVTSAGFGEQSLLGTLSYGLYGEDLCNRVLPISLPKAGSDNGDIASNISAINGADFIVLYTADVHSWEDAFPELSDCLTKAYSIDGTETFPQSGVVFLNSCA